MGLVDELARITDPQQRYNVANQTGTNWGLVSNEEKTRIRRAALAKPERQLKPGDLVACVSTNASQDIGELGVVLAIGKPDQDGDTGAFVMTNSKRSGFQLGWSFIYPYLAKVNL